jgi:chromatin remodeling complex protein RSC6
MKKYCNKCKSKKDISLFYNCSSKKDGKSSNCKKCDDKAKALWRSNNLIKARAYDKNRTWDKNGEKRKKDNERSSNNRLEMSDSYICELATKKSKTLKPEDLSDEFIKTYRLSLKLKRMLGLTPKLKSST